MSPSTLRTVFSAIKMKEPPPPQRIKIVMTCLWTILRVQRLEEIMRQLVKKSGLQNWSLSSGAGMIVVLHIEIEITESSNQIIQFNDQSKLPRILSLHNVYNLKQKSNTQWHLGKLHFLSTILSCDCHSMSLFQQIFNFYSRQQNYSSTWDNSCQKTDTKCSFMK